MNSFNKPADSATVEKYAFSVYELMPQHKDIPSEFGDRSNQWHKMVSEWFFNGLDKNTVVIPKEGIDNKSAMRHIYTVLNSWRPKHEHKTAACAYLMSLWFKQFGDAKH